MPIKESDDEFNSSELLRGSTVRTELNRPSQYLALAIATFGVGFVPLAPGTWGSMVGVGIYLLLRFLVVGALPFILSEVVTISVITLVGIWAASQTERLLGHKDPSKVVVDEVAGQLISLLPVSFVPLWSNWKVWVIFSFVLFRFFDIIKPYPGRRMERLPGGAGIMCDDLIAGVYAASVLLVSIALMWLI